MLCGNNGKFKHTHLNQLLMVKLGHADHWVDAASSLVDVQHDRGRAFRGTVGGELEQVWRLWSHIEFGIEVPHNGTTIHEGYIGSCGHISPVEETCGKSRRDHLQSVRMMKK